MDDQVWTVKRILDWIEGFLEKHGDENPKLSAQWLVSEALGVNRIQLFMDPERPLTEEERSILRDYTRRRGAGEPLQYITGTTDFRFITVMVEHGVLIPRPETEVLVSEALSQLETAAQVKAAKRQEAEQLEEAFMQKIAAKVLADPNGLEATQVEGLAESSGLEGPQAEGLAESEVPEGSHEQETVQEPHLKVLDLCTGTGCIACSIASEVPYSQVVATDIDPKAVSLARRNAEALGVADRVQVVECNLADGVESASAGTFDLLISNPPYIPTAVLSEMDAEVTDYESSLALDGGEDGLDLFRRILPIGKEYLQSGGVLALELHETCLDQAAVEAKDAGYDHVRIAQDLAGRPRVLIAQKG